MNTFRTWATDWPKRVLKLVKARGYPNVTDFLESIPAVPYATAAEQLAPWVAAMQISRLHISEAKHAGLLRKAAMDAFTRELAYCLSEGWNTGANADSRAAAAYARAATSLSVEAGHPELVERMTRMFSELVNLRPPTAWRPLGRHDPLIVDAFRIGWPVE